MKFNGEIKFPDLDHPGVPVQALIEDSQLELVVEEESLGRWSLYDVEARRLVASAFLLKLDGEEVTFVAADPIDFAYRGVEHMAETWAQIKAKRMPTRSMAIRVSRKGTVPSRVGDLRAAMEANLEVQARPRGIAGESATRATHQVDVVEPLESVDPGLVRNWDDRSSAASIPVVGETVSEPEPIAMEPEMVGDDVVDPLAEERRQLEEQKAHLEAEIRAAEEREQVRLEAYRLEMERLERERAEARRLAEETALRAAALAASEKAEAEAKAHPEPEPESEPVALEPDLEPEPVAVEPDPEPEPVAVEPEPEPVPEPVLEPVAKVLDLNDYEAGSPQQIPSELPEPEPAMAVPSKDKAGLMGAVRSAFAKGGGKNHEHTFLEAPGGLGITRYVCEECGYVSISA